MDGGEWVKNVSWMVHNSYRGEIQFLCPRVDVIERWLWLRPQIKLCRGSHSDSNLNVTDTFPYVSERTSPRNIPRINRISSSIFRHVSSCFLFTGAQLPPSNFEPPPPPPIPSSPVFCCYFYCAVPFCKQQK